MGTVLTDTFYSKVLGIDWNYSVYIPEDYQKGKSELWFLMHGANGHQLNFLERIDMKKHLDAIETKDVFVFVDGFNSFYLDGPGIAMESALMKDLIPEMKERYGSSAINLAGISMGGYAALRLSFKYSNSFSKVAAISPAVWSVMKEGTATYHWHVFRDKKGQFDHEMWSKEHPSSYLSSLKDHQTRYFIMTGKQDEAVAYQEVEKLYHDMKKMNLDVVYCLDETGSHAWPFWDVAMQKMLQYFED